MHNRKSISINPYTCANVSQGEYKGCDCVVHATSRPRMISTPWLELQETLVTPLTSCNTDYRSGMDAVSFKT